MSPRIAVGPLRLVWTILLLVLSSSILFAQQAEQQPSKVDLYAGYAYLNPGGSVAGQDLHSINKGFVIQSTYYLDEHWGITVDGAGHFNSDDVGGSNIGTLMVGPTVRFQSEGMTPFIHALGGWHFLAPNFDKNSNALGVILGGGVDLHITPRINLRVLEADYEYAHHNYNPRGNANLSSARISGGLVFRFGNFGPPPPPPSAACSVQPLEVFEGEPVTGTVSGSNFNPKHSLSYAWTGQGVNVSGTNQSVQVDTKGLQPGQYAIKATVTDNNKKGVSADCSANFTVKQPLPPTISCSANPSTLQPGGTSTITCQGNSPQGRQLKYAHQASAGNVTGEGESVTLNTQGAEPGPVTVTSTVTDDRNLSANTTTTVTVEAPPPPPPPPPSASQLNQIDFKRNSARVDNKAKAILDDVALRLQRDADGKVVIIGGSDAKERRGARLASERAMNAKNYLVKEKGIDPSRIEVRSGGEGMTAVIWWVPAGAAAPNQGTPVTETMPMPHKAARHATKKKPQ